MKLFWAVFFSVFLAELGDKTQIASFCFAASNKNCALVVFAASSLALVLATAIGVSLGSFAAFKISDIALQRISGTVFMVLGLWLLFKTM